MSLQQETKQKLRDVITAFSKFTESERQEWLGYVDLFPSEHALFVLELFETSPDDVMVLHKNLMEKRKIIARQDKAAWQELLKKESVFLQDLAKQ